MWKELYKAYLVARIPRPSPLGLVVLPFAWFIAMKRCTQGAVLFGFFRNPERHWLVLYGLTGFAAGFVWPLWALYRFPGSVARLVAAVRKNAGAKPAA